MRKRFLRSELSRTGYIYPDNYIGSGYPDTYTVGSDGDGVIGGYERALVLGYVSEESGQKKSMAVRLLDLRHIDGSQVYGVVPEDDVFLGRVDRMMPGGAKTLFAGNIVTVFIVGASQKTYFSKCDIYNATYVCSRRRVLEDVRNKLKELSPDDCILGRVCGRGKNWSYKVDVGGGFRIFINERTLGKHSVHSKSGMTGGLILLRKALRSSYGETECIPCAATFGALENDILHGAQARGVLTRADGDGQNYAYIPNIGFIYIAGYVSESGDNRPLPALSVDGTVEIGGKALQLGSVAQIEVVRTNDGNLCGYIKCVLSADATSGCALL